METTSRPIVTINCASSADGRLALPDRKQLALSSKEDFWRVHRMRASSDAILVGIGTVLNDDPKLTVSPKYYALEQGEKNPTRIVLDTKGRTPRSAMVMNEMSPTIIATANGVKMENLPPNVSQLECGIEGDRDRISIENLLLTLSRKGIRTLMVEGGPIVIGSFLKERLFDHFYVYFAPVIIGGGPPIAEDVAPLDRFSLTRLKLESVERLGDGFVVHYLPKKNGV